MSDLAERQNADLVLPDAQLPATRGRRSLEVAALRVALDHLARVGPILDPLCRDPGPTGHRIVALLDDLDAALSVLLSVLDAAPSMVAVHAARVPQQLDALETTLQGEWANEIAVAHYGTVERLTIAWRHLHSATVALRTDAVM